MSYVISILVLAAVITAWGYFFSKWNKAGGGCGSCTTLPGKRPCRQDSCQASGKPDGPEPNRPA